MPMRPSRTFAVASALAASASIGAGGGAATYALLSSDGGTTVVRQVTVADAEPAAETTPSS